jgi:hypothetical protein
MIQILKWNAHRSGALIGFADVSISSWRLEIRGLSVFEKSGSRWCELPKKPYEVNGKTKYQDILAWSDAEVRARFQKAVVDALVRQGHIPPVEATAPRQNRRNPDRMTYRGGQYRPDDFQGVQPLDSLPY